MHCQSPIQLDGHLSRHIKSAASAFPVSFSFASSVYIFDLCTSTLSTRRATIYRSAHLSTSKTSTTNIQPTYFRKDHPSKMSSSDLEKGAGTHDYHPQTPAPAYSMHRESSFRPAYQANLNENLRNWQEPEGQANVKEFDHIEEPKHSKRRCMKREWLIAGAIVAILLLIVLPWVIMVVLKNAEKEDKVSTPSSFSNMTQLIVTETVQVPTVQTRSETTFSYAPLTTAVIPSTVYITVLPPVTITATVTAPTTLMTVSTESSDPETVTKVRTKTLSPDPTTVLTTLIKVSTEPTTLLSISTEVPDAETITKVRTKTLSPDPTTIVKVSTELTTLVKVSTEPTTLVSISTLVTSEPSTTVPFLAPTTLVSATTVLSVSTEATTVISSPTPTSTSTTSSSSSFGGISILPISETTATEVSVSITTEEASTVTDVERHTPTQTASGHIGFCGVDGSPCARSVGVE